jgi:hypothetical protein
MRGQYDRPAMFVGMACLAGLGAASVAATTPNGAVPDVLAVRIATGQSIERYVYGIVEELRTADRDEDGLDAKDLARNQAAGSAQYRSREIANVLAHDLNGDFKVTAAELLDSLPGKLAARTERADAMLKRLDANRDGQISLTEAARPNEPRIRITSRTDELLKLDPSGDGRLTATELRMLAERAFASFDRDGDGVISPEEGSFAAERLTAARIAQNAPQCDLPPLPRGAQLVVYGGYGAQSLASVSIGGADQVTGLIDVVIEPGSAPLYLVLSSYDSIIWRLSGATDRVARVILSSSQTAKPEWQATPPDAVRVEPKLSVSTALAASGVLGVDASRVAFARRACPQHASGKNKTEPEMIRATLRRSLGRDPDAIAISYAAQRVALPSGKVEQAAAGAAPVPPGFDAETWASATRFWPGGLARVDPKTVVASYSVQPYAILPSQMGLAQLVGSGHAIRVSPNAFRIVKPISHLPSGMVGAHMAKLILAPGVPTPSGNPGHSCILREGEAKPLYNPRLC